MAWRRKFRDKSFNNLETKAKKNKVYFFASCLPANWRSSMQKCWMGSGMEKLLTDFSSFLSILSCETKEAWFGIFLLTVCDVIWINLQFWKELCLNYVTVCEVGVYRTLWSVLNVCLKLWMDVWDKKDLNFNSMDIFNFTLMCRLFEVFKFLSASLNISSSGLDVYSLVYGIRILCLAYIIDNTESKGCEVKIFNVFL